MIDLLINVVGVLVFFWPWLLITALFALCAVGGSVILFRNPASSYSSPLKLLRKSAAFLIILFGLLGLWLLYIYVYHDLIFR